MCPARNRTIADPRSACERSHHVNGQPRSRFYFAKSDKWQSAFVNLRTLILGTDLQEKLKWGHPCYAKANANIVLMHGFKGYCALLFFKGALMEDPGSLLIQQTENVQAARQIRFTDAAQIDTMGNLLTSYIQNAIEIEMSGRKIVYRQPSDLTFPAEFQTRIDTDPDLKAAFAALTPGRQKGYTLYFSSAKQAKTRDVRIAKSIPRILVGKGLEDE